MRTAEAWEALQEALKSTEPSCAGFDEFTADQLSDAEREWCAAVCRGCMVFQVCKQYADAARPAAGFYAGRSRRGAVR